MQSENLKDRIKVDDEGQVTVEGTSEEIEIIMTYIKLGMVSEQYNELIEFLENDPDGKRALIKYRATRTMAGDSKRHGYKIDYDKETPDGQ